MAQHLEDHLGAVLPCDRGPGPHGVVGKHRHDAGGGGRLERTPGPDGHVGDVREGRFPDIAGQGQTAGDDAGRLGARDGIIRAEDLVARLSGLARDDAAVDSGGHVGPGPGWDGLVVREPGAHGHGGHGQLGDGGGQGDKLGSRDRLIGIEKAIGPHRLAHQDAGLPQGEGGVMGRAFLHISVVEGLLGGPLEDVQGHGGHRRHIAPAVGGRVGKAVLAALSAGGGVDKGALLDLHRALPGLAHQLEGDRVAVQVGVPQGRTQLDPGVGFK